MATCIRCIIFSLGMWLILIGTVVKLSEAYSSGAPGKACDTMVPRHRSDPQEGPSNMTISLSQTSFGCGDSIEVALAGMPFKGFLCQARPDPEVFNTTGIIECGDFKDACDTHAAVTHVDSSVKDNATMVWKQSGDAKDFYIVCTIVRDKQTFWVREKSHIIVSRCSQATFISPSRVISLGLFMIPTVMTIF